MSLMTEINTAYHSCSIERLTVLEKGSSSSAFFACGSYELNEDAGTRAGSIGIMSYDSSSRHLSITEECSCESGVLDIKVNGCILGSAMSDGSLDLYKVVMDCTEDKILSKITTVSKSDEGLFLSLDFNSRLSSGGPSSDDRIGVSTQASSIILYKHTEAALIEDAQICTAHSMMGEAMPAWIVVFDPHSRHTLLSGGDDCKFRLWDLRTVDDSGGDNTPISVNKQHTAGVTSAQWHPHNTNVFVTGSYDEHAIVWDCRNLQKPLLDIHTGGGVWRAKWYVDDERNSSEEYLVTASMQGGSRVYNLNSTTAATDESTSAGYALRQSVMQTDERNPNHLAYGIDIIGHTKTDDSSRFTLASCSFYDNMVQIWNAEFVFA